jgi:hypothetical protein
MTKYFHIVQVHPVENGEPNLYKVKWEREFDTKEAALDYINWCDANFEPMDDDMIKAVYLGCVNDETGELV